MARIQSSADLRTQIRQQFRISLPGLRDGGLVEQVAPISLTEEGSLSEDQLRDLAAQLGMSAHGPVDILAQSVASRLIGQAGLVGEISRRVGLRVGSGEGQVGLTRSDESTVNRTATLEDRDSEIRPRLKVLILRAEKLPEVDCECRDLSRELGVPQHAIILAVEKGIVSAELLGMEGHHFKDITHYQAVRIAYYAKNGQGKGISREVMDRGAEFERIYNEVCQEILAEREKQ